MRKFLAMVLGMVMVLSMVGCGKSDTPTITDTTTSVSTETSTEVIPHTERVQETVEVESTIDKENACAIDTIYFTFEKPMATLISYNPKGEEETINCFEMNSDNFGKEMKCDVYYFEYTTIGINPSTGSEEEVIAYTYEYEISLAE